MPADLVRAVLRRAWAADPAVRDFIGLSENSWDFNAPHGVPGFGSLTAEDARRLLARVMEGTGALDPARATGTSASEPGRPAPDSARDKMKPTRDTDADHRNPVPRAETSNIAMQHVTGERKSRPPAPRRRHGSALPD